MKSGQKKSHLYITSEHTGAIMSVYPHFLIFIRSIIFIFKIYIINFKIIFK